MNDYVRWVKRPSRSTVMFFLFWFELIIVRINAKKKDEEFKMQHSNSILLKLEFKSYVICLLG